MVVVNPTRLLVLAGNLVLLDAAVDKPCPGQVNIRGFGLASLVPTGWRTLDDFVSVDVPSEREVMPKLGSRAYFSEDCTGTYNSSQYLAFNLLGKTVTYTTDISTLGCGCNAAFYFTPMRHNTRPSECHDYYCDANNVCGESCAELDIQEGNQYSWHSTLHAQTDPAGLGRGYGGGGPGWSGPRQWSFEEYGPGAGCIDTMRPFQVTAMFPADEDCKLTGVQVTLSQAGHVCQLRLDLDSYSRIAELSETLSAGMTPIVSYWSSDDLQWMDGVGMDGKGPCQVDNGTLCGASASFSDFSIEDIDGSLCKVSLTSQTPAKRTEQFHSSSALPVQAQAASTTSGYSLIEDQLQGPSAISPIVLALIGFFAGATATIVVLALISLVRNRRVKRKNRAAPAQEAACEPRFARPASCNNLLPVTSMEEVQEQQETPPEVQR